MREPRFWYPARRGSTPLAARLLSPAGAIFGLAGRIRRASTKPERAAVPVICIGNITAGGTGKTPLALTIAERLIAAGEKVHFLTRGYGGRETGPIRVDLAHHGAEDVGDEPLLLARTAPVWVAANRPEGAAAAVRGGAGLIVMDDGLQNPSLEKDFSILVVDAASGLGNGRLIPAGPLRERMDDALSRTNALILTGRGHAGDGIAARARARAIPVFNSIVRPASPPSFAEGPWLAFAGIGRPEKFFRTLRELGVELADTVAFPDHHPFRENDALRLLVRARELGATLITTEKDAARLVHAPSGSARARLAEAAQVLPVRALVGDIDALMALIADALVRARRR
ncbi:tetraacyldisaccharide 4'-kinase [Parvibaculum sp.]|jgi:tetraacyldisaccharide 4'-kinase|uniref:tetraacyldisaccharide 4'-kinase n=1 Tax=Parvibaculum sp. TaxID=2024848 RepID=UPI000C620269|nr:tetraacyldisaccharide 4'-kinase [Parvibaculum sp.]MAU61993.1 tetraacyldisaccharide 4'-kinase [Parvibaculum sp.]MBO6666885.1 tetraacyldisaccharide 4'-kinase [Parvibaculum sp.]MBO6691910.1 tetraacyldisaccharide 4'-kinase [Parvibaculum sp.]MBO6713506.1 tetraacyldisaccharide 4'-kinase [Parvibaculum sp.]|tara:strand:- start:2700 stop:3728 length:1029 start_codon:yes stop_codon:yes gene_type:complete